MQTIIATSIDCIKPPYVGGWLLLNEPASEPPKVFLTKDGQDIGSGIADQTRTDFGTQTNHVGFWVRANAEITLSDIADGTIKVKAQTCAGETEVRLWDPLKLSGLINKQPNQQIEITIREIDATKRKYIFDLMLSHYGDVASNESENNIRSAPHISPDEVAVLGRNDNYFLYRGTNDLVGLYNHKDCIEHNLSNWENVISRRVHECEIRGLRYMQMMIPEKSSLMPELVPYEIEGPSRPWKELLRRLERIPGQWDLIDVYSLLQSDPAGGASYRRYDSHFSDWGCRVVCSDFLKRLGGDTLPSTTGQSWLRRKGDLSEKFGDGEHLVEYVRISDNLVDHCGKEIEPRLVESEDQIGRNTGIRRVWRTDNAPVRKTVICFGNSFFERGELSTSLSWWFSRIFSEFHFIWATNIDWSYIDKHSADVVIFQTIERFLRGCPES